MYFLKCNVHDANEIFCMFEWLFSAMDEADFGSMQQIGSAS